MFDWVDEGIIFDYWGDATPLQRVAHNLHQILSTNLHYKIVLTHASHPDSSYTNICFKDRGWDLYSGGRGFLMELVHNSALSFDEVMDYISRDWIVGSKTHALNIWTLEEGGVDYFLNNASLCKPNKHDFGFVKPKSREKMGLKCIKI